MQKQKITEGKATIYITPGEKISKKLPVFYNPVMKLNRDMTVLVLNSLDKKDMQMALPLAGTGIRGIRLMKELKKGKIKSMSLNDLSENAVKLIKENLKINNIKKDVSVYCKDANIFLLESTGFDYIDIDPFGSPNKFLNSAVERISRGGILAATATDTSALTGSHPKACLRKYWAVSKTNPMMHEIGVRILIRKIQLIGAQFEKAFTPIFSYASDHYYKVFLRCEKGKSRVDEVLKKHGMFDSKGPLWLGRLWETDLAARMLAQDFDFDDKLKSILETIKEESAIDSVGSYDIHELCKKNRLEIPKYEKIFKSVHTQGYPVSRTSFNKLGIKSTISETELLSIIKKGGQ